MKRAHTLLTLLVCATVVLTGCVGGLGGGSSASSGAATDGGDGDAGSNGASNTNVEPREEGWLNVTKNGYVFEINDARNGSGTATFEPPADPTQSLIPNATFEGDEPFEQVYRAKAENLTATTVVLYPLSLGRAGSVDFFGLLDENLAVGHETTREDYDGEDEYTAKITGIESYAGIGCYATEITLNGKPTLDTCIVPSKGDDPVTWFPYVAFYDENGELNQEIKLTEIKEE